MPDACTHTAGASTLTTTNRSTDHMTAPCHANAIATINVDEPVVADTIAPSSPVGESLSRSPVTYNNIGIQTLPPPNAATFSLVHGRNPKGSEFERKIGLAALGRYKKSGTNPQDLVHGAAFQVEQRRTGIIYADSGFQTNNFLARNMAIAKAKAKASMTATRYKRVAAECGYNIWAESNDDNIIHSEQCSVHIKLDIKGNAQEDEDLTGRFLPNIYKDEVDVEPRRDGAAQAVLPKNDCPAILSQHLTPPSAPPVSAPQHDGGLLLPIAAIEPSTREGSRDSEDDKNSKDSEDLEYTDGFSCAYAPGSDCFVVFDAEQAASLPLAQAPRRSQKRKASLEFGHDDEDREPKRARSLLSKDRTSRPKDRPEHNDRRQRQCSRSRALSASCSTTSSRSPSPPRRSHRRLSVGRVEPLRESFRRRNDRHDLRHRSRSPEGSRKEAYRVRNTSRRRTGERARDRYSSCHDSRQDHCSPHPHRARDVRSRNAVKDNIQPTKATISIPVVAKGPKATNTLSNSRSRQAEQSKSLAQESNTAAHQTHNSPQPDRRIQREELKLIAARRHERREEHEIHTDVAIKNQEQVMLLDREAEDRRREAHNAKKTETRTPQQGQKHSIEEVKSYKPKKETESLIKVNKKIEPPKREEQKDEVSKKKTEGRILERTDANPTQNGRKRSIEEIEPTISKKAIEPQKKVKTEDERPIEKNQERFKDNRNEKREQKKTGTPQKESEPRTRRAPREEMQRYVPRALRQNVQAAEGNTNRSNNVNNRA